MSSSPATEVRTPETHGGQFVAWALARGYACEAKDCPRRYQQPTRFYGLLKRGKDAVWRCKHEHAVREDAVRCAHDEQRRRYYAGEE